MSTNNDTTEQPHLVSLALQSKKALQHGEQLCSKAQSAYNASAQEAIDVLALDAKIRWVTEAISQQLKLASNVAKCIEEKRASLAKQTQAWDTSRTKYTDALESILDLLGRQVVPPDFHETSADSSSLFGSQHSEDPAEGLLVSPSSSPTNYTKKPGLDGPLASPVSPSATLRRNGPVSPNANKGKGTILNTRNFGKERRANRSNWKTLRDFVDDRAIEDILETIENDRNTLEDTLNQTADYPTSLRRTISSIQDSLPKAPQVPILTQMQDTLTAQDVIVTSMAEKLESLAAHYDQMATALRDSEAGEAFNDEDMQSMNRDTEELPIILHELDEGAKQIDDHFEKLSTSRKEFQQDLVHLSRVLDSLDELGDIMGEMLEAQDSVETKCNDSLGFLQQHIETLDHLQERYVLYQKAFNKLVLEIARRRRYRESADLIIQGMMSQLKAMTEEESEVRKHFNTEYGAHLPEDICLCIANEPTRWEVVPWPGDIQETLPEIDADLIDDAQRRIGVADITVGPESV